MNGSTDELHSPYSATTPVIEEGPATSGSNPVKESRIKGNAKVANLSL